MPQPASQLDLMQALINRGLLATGGNIRSLPFADGSSAPSDANGAGAGGSADGASSVPRPEGPSPVLDANNQLVDPNTGKPPSNADDWWKYLVAGAGIAGGAALANLIRNKMKGSKVPTVEGEVIDPLSPAATSADDVIINGEYSDVPNAMVGAPPKGLPSPDASVAGPPTPAQVLAERKLGVRNRPNANPVATSDSSVVRTGDALADIDPAELERAREITKQLIANRMSGNAQRAGGTNLRRKYDKPTGPVAPEEGILNTVIRLMRENGALRSAVARAP